MVYFYETIQNKFSPHLAWTTTNDQNLATALKPGCFSLYLSSSLYCSLSLPFSLSFSFLSLLFSDSNFPFQHPSGDSSLPFMKINPSAIKITPTILLHTGFYLSSLWSLLPHAKKSALWVFFVCRSFLLNLPKIGI